MPQKSLESPKPTTYFTRKHFDGSHEMRSQRMFSTLKARRIVGRSIPWPIFPKEKPYFRQINYENTAFPSVLWRAVRYANASPFDVHNISSAAQGKFWRSEFQAAGGYAGGAGGCTTRQAFLRVTTVKGFLRKSGLIPLKIVRCNEASF